MVPDVGASTLRVWLRLLRIAHPVTTPSMSGSMAPLIRIGSAVLVVGALYWGRAVLIPLVLAALLSFLLAPIADWLDSRRIPRVASVLLTVLTTFVVFAGIGSIITVETVGLVKSLPEYHQNIEQRFHAFQTSKAALVGRIDGLTGSVEGSPAGKPASAPGTPGATGSSDRTAAAGATLHSRAGEPVPVTIQPPAPSASGLFRSYAAPLLGPLGTAGIVAIFVLFMLLQRDDLRDRMIRLLGTGHLDVTTRALAEGGHRVSRYLLMELAINVTYGIPIGVGLWLIGVPGAALWGLLAAVLRFIPYIGVWLAAALPFALSLAVFHGWLGALAVAGLFVVVELVVANVMEPWLYGSSTGMSPLGVLVAVVFWSALWGPVGLVLAIPLTACLVVAGRYVPQLEFFSILLGRDPALSPVVQFYQRLLAGDDDEAEDLADEHLRRHGLVSLYDEVMIPALHLAERDRHDGKLEADREQTIREICKGIVDDLLERPPHAESEPHAEPAPPAAATAAGKLVLCVPARDEADALTAQMFAHVLATQGIAAEAVSGEALVGEIIERIAKAGTPLICISALPPGAIRHTRYLCKRLDARFPDLAIVVGLWNVSGNLERIRTRLADTGADHVFTTFAAGAAEVARSAQHFGDPAAAPATDGAAVEPVDQEPVAVH